MGKLCVFTLAKLFDEKNTTYAELIRVKGAAHMISYSPFWKTLENSNENWYTLTKKHHMSHSTLHRLKHNMDISTKTVNDLCRILNCRIQDIAEYIPSEDDQAL